MSFSVHLDVFEGPLDLLLQLVSRERVDVAEVSIATITDEYLQAVRALGELDLDAATSFLVLAATLLELKSLKLLPREEVDPETAALLEERDRLLHRLVEYATFKAASEAIALLLKAGEGYFNRAAGMAMDLPAELPDPLEGVTAERFHRVALKVFSPKIAPPQTPVDTSHITSIRLSVAEMIELLAGELRGRRSATFRDLCGGGASRAEVVVRFLALLELFRRSNVEMDQDGPESAITVRWRQPRVGSE